MKKIFGIIVIVIISVLIILSLVTGGARTDVYLKSYELSSNGKVIKLEVGVTSSMGYIRDIKVSQGGDCKYITFYSTYGINNKLGAKDIFEIELDLPGEEIYFYSGGDKYKKVLEKDENGQYVMVRGN